jgi:hypothetical protein
MDHDRIFIINKQKLSILDMILYGDPHNVEI